MKRWAVSTSAWVSIAVQPSEVGRRRRVCPENTPGQASQCLLTPSIYLKYLKSDDEHTDGVADRNAPQVVGQPQFGVLQLPLISPTLALQVHFIQHPQTAGTDRVSKGFQPAIGLYRQLPIKVKEPGLDILLRLASGTEL